MARTRSIFNNPLRGNLGNQTFKDYSGVQVVTSRIYSSKSKGDGATLDQRISRLLMPNLTLCASTIREYLPIFFEKNRYYKTPYTHFLSHNMGKQFPVLPKDMIERKLFYFGNFQVSCGTLPPITVQNRGQALYTNLRVFHNAFGDTRKLGDLSRGLIQYNPDWKDGDFLFFLRIRYYEDSSSMEPAHGNTRIKLSWIQLDTLSSKYVIDCMYGDRFYITDGGDAQSRYFIYFDDSEQDAVALIHVRKVMARYQSSTSIVVGNDYFNSNCNKYSSDPYLTKCAATWGYKEVVL